MQALATVYPLYVDTDLKVLTVTIVTRYVYCKRLGMHFVNPVYGWKKVYGNEKKICLSFGKLKIIIKSTK